MPLTKEEYEEFCTFLDTLKEYGHHKNYSLIRYADVRDEIDKYYKNSGDQDG